MLNDLDTRALLRMFVLRWIDKFGFETNVPDNLSLEQSVFQQEYLEEEETVDQAARLMLQWRVS